MKDISEKIDEIFRNENSLLSTSLEEIIISKNENDEVQIFLMFSNFPKKSNFSHIKLLFENIVEYSFYYNNDYNFYNVERYKLLKIENNIYLSLDPDDSVDGKAASDMDYILAKKLTLFEE